jgi:hypothetical protein
MFSKVYAGSSIKKNLQTINAILNEVCKENSLMQYRFSQSVRLAEINPRGCLTVDEVVDFFSIGKWPDQRAFTASLLSTSTGL